MKDYDRKKSNLVAHVKAVQVVVYQHEEELTIENVERSLLIRLVD